MAHFAQINSENLVIRVTRVSNDFLMDDSGQEDEQKGIDYLQSLLPIDNCTWIQTSYNTYRGVHLKGGVPLRKNYAGIGYTYDPDLDGFCPPSPYSSWTLSTESCQWEAPTPPPPNQENGLPYIWNEENLKWTPLAEPAEEVNDG